MGIHTCLLQFESQKREEMSKRVKVKVVKGADLVVRDRRSSDPYVVLTLGNNKAKTRVVWQNLNPVWNEEFVFPITDTNRCFLKIKVWDKDKFLSIDHLDPDDYMGEAEVDLNQLVNGVSDVKKDKIVLPTSKSNCFFRDSYVTESADGKRVQEACLKLRKVDSGVVDLQIECPA
ncbi:hypothetical protein SUGI_0284600 [Cryptomeria japonica]|uniref:GTPase activating protein 1 n=1 Tax=Cryptomeria japonica TaxID=3369 RepID=UPI002408BF60|nr:GTPase activating protein 1 [Cryptomeria japonica]GLJ16601.1 hypothetical protein SUGI_0284600 [Cryptomeria japonica]